MDNLELLRLSENQDVEAYEQQDFEDQSSSDIERYKQQYSDFYNDVKQSSKYIKEDW